MSKNTSNAHPPRSEPGVPNPSEEPQTGEESGPPAKIRKVGEDNPNPGTDTTAPTSSREGPSQPADEESPQPISREGSTESEDEPSPKSSPCTCRCGGCCCHGTSEPQHCVRCHTNYTFNHSKACVVPHVFSFFDLEHSADCLSYLSVRSVCCGSNVLGGEPIKGDWRHTFPCFVGWHTTDAGAVKEQYNGINVLRCDPGPGGKCLRTRMKHRAHHENLFDAHVKYNKIDKTDHRRYLKRKRDEMHNDRVFKHVFREGVSEDEED